MSAMHDIRVRIFRISQTEMAQIAGVHQASVSRWENDVQEPSRAEMARIRDEAAKRGLAWDDEWFFTPPQTQAEQPGAAA